MTDKVQLIRLKEADLPEFKREMQKAFQYGYEAAFGPCEDAVLPEEDIDRSLKDAGAIAYGAWKDGVMAGGAVVKIDRVGQAIWNGIESLHPETEIWETCTPCFEKRNIHFYVNRCGFHIVEFFHPRHQFPAPEWEYHGGMADEASQYFFRFVKVMHPRRPDGCSGKQQ